MNTEVKQILQSVQSGEMTVEEAELLLKKEPFADLGFAKVDLHRKVRQGMTEVIYGAGKTAEQIAGIARELQKNGQGTILITRMSEEKAQRIKEEFALSYHAEAQIGIIGELPRPDGIGRILVVTGGTSDIPVAEEAALTAEVFGNEVERVYDVGVAGTAPSARPSGCDHERERHRRNRGDGGRTGKCGRRARRLPGDRGADQRRLRRVL